MAAKVAPGEETKEVEKKADNAVVLSPADEKKKVSRRDKNYYLLNAITEDYVDDSDLYKARMTRAQRLEYWDIMQEQKVRRNPPEGRMSYQKAWMKGEYDVESQMYPSLFKWWFALVKMPLWDYIYLFLFLLYLFVIIAVYDGLGADLVPGGLISANSTTPAVDTGGYDAGSLDPEIAANAAAIGLGPATMLLPVIFMLLIQGPPSIGAFYFINRCNDLVKYTSRTTTFGGWSFTTIFISQSCEYFFYGGADNLKGAGTCAFSERTMSFFGKKKVVVGDLDANFEREEPSDDEDDEVDDPYPVGHETIDERIEKARIELEKDLDNPDKQALVKGTKEISVLQKIIDEKKRKEQEAEYRLKQIALDAEKSCTEWAEWKCLVCNKDNRRPRHPPPVTDIFFGEKGVFFKRTYAIIKPRKDQAMCSHCGTYADYKEPLGSAHTFPYNKKPYRAFENYPIPTAVHAGLVDTPFSRAYNNVVSWLFGIRNNSNSQLVYNDWRLRLYLNGRFPETPRQVKPKRELYKVGEYLECKLQKSEWSRCLVLKAKTNHTYDIRYDPGDELRLVEEKELRLPPEKKAYAYIVEIIMCYLVITFPLSVIASQSITPALLTFFPFCGAAFLTFLRISKLIKFSRDFKYAGIWPLLKLSMFYTIPLILMTLACAAPLIGFTWVFCSYLWIACKMFSLPVLYIMKPNFAVFGGILFIQTSAGMYLLGNYADDTAVFGNQILPHIAPFVTSTLTLIYYRKNLHTFIDVSLAIRPPLNYVKPDNICIRLYHMLVKPQTEDNGNGNADNSNSNSGVDGDISISPDQRGFEPVPV